MQSSIDVEPAWSHTLGSPGVVVAVLDTGVRFDHADLMRVAAGGNLLPGYDMISDVDVAQRRRRPRRRCLRSRRLAHAGRGRRSRAASFEDCATARRTARGTARRRAGSSRALTGNGIGMASVGRNVRVLPVRVLGKCGGYDSDIIAGMRWAVGLPVAGVPGQPQSRRAC